MSLTSCPPSFRIVKLGNPDAERDSINAALQAIVRCLAHSSIPDPTGHAGEYLSTDGTDIFWAAGGGGGGVTSVALSTGASGVSVSGSPITGAGTITLGLGTMAPVNDAPSDGTTYGRKNNAWEPAAGISYTDTGITVIGGVLGGAAVTAAIVSEVRGISTGDYDWTTTPGNWQLWVDAAPVAGDFTVSVRAKAFSNAAPSISDSVSTGLDPTLVGNGVDLTASGSTTGWTGGLAVGDMLTVVPTLNSAGIKWWCLFIPARRTF